MNTMNKKIVISVNTAWNIHNFRSGLVKALIAQGYDVMVMAPADAYAHRLASLGCRFKTISMDNNGTSPSRDLSLLVKYWRVLQSVRPLAYLGYTIKPNIYGSIAAHRLGIPVINNIAGLGATFISNSPLTYLVKQLYRCSLRQSSRVFFQNADDCKLFVDAGLARPDVAEVLPGSGIDLQQFQPAPALPATDGFCFLLVARMLRDKGIEEYAAAARIVRQQLPEVRFQLLGPIDTHNPNSIPFERIAGWKSSGLIEYLKEADDVRPYLARADCVVLPSYREGVPHTLLEAAAMARPTIATNVAGCKDIVEHQANGLLCKVKDAADLADKMVRMVRLTHAQRLAMGQVGRNKVVAQFDENVVIARYLNTLRQIEANGHAHAVQGLETTAQV
jgi:glycosyltransferase involved in cell wall biosynthesis